MDTQETPEQYEDRVTAHEQAGYDAQFPSFTTDELIENVAHIKGELEALLFASFSVNASDERAKLRRRKGYIEREIAKREKP